MAPPVGARTRAGNTGRTAANAVILTVAINAVAAMLSFVTTFQTMFAMAERAAAVTAWLRSWRTGRLRRRVRPWSGPSR